MMLTLSLKYIKSLMNCHKNSKPDYKELILAHRVIILKKLNFKTVRKDVY